MMIIAVTGSGKMANTTMMFPNTVREFMEQYKMVDTEQIYSNGIEYVPIFRMEQWFAHQADTSRWISVTAGLPEEDKEVLITYRYKEGEGDTSHVNIDITTYGQMYFGGRRIEGVKHWRAPFEYFESNYEVIAWMPLPEPYKGGEGE